MPGGPLGIELVVGHCKSSSAAINPIGLVLPFTMQPVSKGRSSLSSSKDIGSRSVGALMLVGVTRSFSSARRLIRLLKRPMLKVYGYGRLPVFLVIRSSVSSTYEASTGMAPS